MESAERIEEVPEMRGLTFDEVSHTYRLGGVVIPSVSAVIEPLSTAKYEGISKDVLEKAADKGTEVHGAIENWIKFGIEDICEERKPYFDAFLDWWNEHKIQVVGSEIQMYHKILMYGGTADLIAYVDDELTLVDFKTTYVISDLTCGPQLEAYAQALKSHGVSVERKAILQLKKDGEFVYREYPAKDTKCWQVFNALKTVYDYKKSCR